MADIIVNPGQPADRLALQLYTRKRTFVPNEQMRDRSPESVRAAIEFMKQYRPLARVRSTGPYNCLGMVFASRRTFIDPEYLPIIFDGDDYRRLSDHEAPQPGDIVIYKDAQKRPVHVGLVINITKNLSPSDPPHTIEVLSKWGYDGEYVHEVKYVPDVLGTPDEYWTDRKMP